MLKVTGAVDFFDENVKFEMELYAFGTSSVRKKVYVAEE
jgi:hypothetical protein